MIECECSSYFSPENEASHRKSKLHEYNLLHKSLRAAGAVPTRDILVDKVYRSGFIIGLINKFLTKNKDLVLADFRGHKFDMRPGLTTPSIFIHSYYVRYVFTYPWVLEAGKHYYHHDRNLRKQHTFADFMKIIKAA